MKPLWWYQPGKRAAILGGGFLGSFLLIFLAIALGIYFLQPRSPNPDPDPASGEKGPVQVVACVEAVGMDRSASQDSAEVVQRWRQQVTSLIRRARSCDGLVMAETVYDRPGKQKLEEVPFKILNPRNRLDEKQKKDQAETKAQAAIAELIAAPANGGTNLLAFFHSVAAHLQEPELGTPTVTVTLFSDAINTAGGLNMLDAQGKPSPAFLEADVDQLVEHLQAQGQALDCKDWQVRVLGANTTSSGGVDSALAAKAEAFWRAFIGACGGAVVRYDVA